MSETLVHGKRGTEHQENIDRRVVDPSFSCFLESTALQVAPFGQKFNDYRPSSDYSRFLMPPRAFKRRPAMALCTRFWHGCQFKNPDKSIEKRGTIQSLTCTPSGLYFITGLGNGRLVLWSSTTGKYEWVGQKHGSPQEPNSNVLSQRWFRSKHILLSGDDKGSISMHHATLETFWTNKNYLRSYSGMVSDFAVPPGDDRFVSICDRQLVLWTYNRGDFMPEVIGSNGFSANSCDWHGSLSLLASACDDGNVSLWDTRTPALLRSFSAHPRYISRVRFHPTDDKRLITSCQDYSMKLWDVRNLKTCVKTYQHKQGVTTFGIHPHARNVMVSGDQEGSLYWWSLDDDTKPMAYLPYVHNAKVTDIAFHPSGCIVGTGSTDRKLRLWTRNRCGDPQNVHVPPRLRHKGYNFTNHR
ncbi:hypothetical protein PCE1_002665 [Barthelona sp. PCE]